MRAGPRLGRYPPIRAGHGGELAEVEPQGDGALEVGLDQRGFGGELPQGVDRLSLGIRGGLLVEVEQDEFGMLADRWQRGEHGPQVRRWAGLDLDPGRQRGG
jgi:hypothetical protein